MKTQSGTSNIDKKINSEVNHLTNLIRLKDFFFIFLIFPFIIFFGSFFVIGNMKHPEVINPNVMNFIGLCMMMPIILLFIFQMYFLFIFRGIEYTSIRHLNLIKNVNSFDEINKNSEKILKNITQVRGLDFILRMIVTKHSFLLIHKEIVKIIGDKIVPSLHDLRTDLRIQIDSTKSILKGAVSEISENIHGTTELNAVSELQSARLDRQIEQFEELQRVLVKV